MRWMICDVLPTVFYSVAGVYRGYAKGTGGIVFEALVDAVLDEGFETGRFGHQAVEILLCDNQQLAGFEAFDAEEARFAVAETFDGGNSLTFEEELEGDVLAVVVEPKPEAAFFMA